MEEVENFVREYPTEATFQLTIESFKKFGKNKGSKESPCPCVVRSIPWKLGTFFYENDETFLALRLSCYAETELTRVHATAELRLLHQSDPTKNLTKKIQGNFSHGHEEVCILQFATIKDILNKENGLIL